MALVSRLGSIKNNNNNNWLEFIDLLLFAVFHCKTERYFFHSSDFCQNFQQYFRLILSSSLRSFELSAFIKYIKLDCYRLAPHCWHLRTAFSRQKSVGLSVTKSSPILIIIKLRIWKQKPFFNNNNRQIIFI